MGKKKREPQKIDPHGKPIQTSREASGDGQEHHRIRRALLSHLRHELRTPINAIIGYTEMVLEDAEDLDRKDLIPDLQKIHTAAEQMLGLVNDILDPSKFQPGETDLDPENFGVNFRHALRTPLNAIIGYSEMLLENAEDQGQESFIPDLQKIHSAAKSFLALISNIVNFKKIKAGLTDLDLEASDASSLIQAAVSTIYRPSEEDTAELAVQRGSLLVVDDNEMNRDMLSRYLERQGHTVILAENGRHALEAMKTHSFDLILLDIMMPEMNGFQVLQYLKDHDAWRDLPVIMISALDEMESVVRCIEMGAEDYLPKPFDPVLLRARVGACLEKKRLRDIERLYAKSMERELEIGRKIQASFFPEALPRLPGWEIAAHFQAARQVAGDFYDAFLISEGNMVGMVIADVCDKGVGAALFMGLFRSLIRAFADIHFSERWLAQSEDPHPSAAEHAALNEQQDMDSVHAKALKKVIVRTNNYIGLTHGKANMFATLFFGVLNPATGTLTYINGGHEPPAMIGASGVKERLKPTGPAVGMLPDMPFETRQTRFEPGDILIAFTDGITEARSPEGHFLGEERLLKLLEDPAPSADTLLQRIAHSVRAYTAGATQSDDIALLAVRRAPVTATTSD